MHGFRRKLKLLSVTMEGTAESGPPSFSSIASQKPCSHSPSPPLTQPLSLLPLQEAHDVAVKISGLQSSEVLTGAGGSDFKVAHTHGWQMVLVGGRRTQFPHVGLSIGCLVSSQYGSWLSPE